MSKILEKIEDIGEWRRIKYFDDKNNLVDEPQINIYYSFIKEKGKDPQYIAQIYFSKSGKYIRNKNKNFKHFK